MTPENANVLLRGENTLWRIINLLRMAKLSGMALSLENLAADLARVRNEETANG